ncbi:hypothetical protein GW926_03740 [Candidatus Pacearchaeota archaeon]|nr:hypothetical protein [Candidatus Pacearchaeota archaeon]
MNNKAKKIIGLYSALVFIFLASYPVWADRLESDSYVVTFGNFNVTSGEKSSASYNVTDTVGQVANGPYGAYGSSTYFVGGGFQYIYQIDSFAFTISDVSVELGEIIPNTHSSASHDLTITSRGAGGYIIYAYEDHPLRHTNNSTDIPDTACDAASCTISNAEVWTNTSIPGFGFNMTGNDVPSDFTDSTYFRPFADDESGDPMQIVMSSSNIANARTSTVTYKAGVDVTQSSGNYQTNISYVAVPGY